MICVFWDRHHDTPFGYFWDRSRPVPKVTKRGIVVPVPKVTKVTMAYFSNL